MNKLKELRDFSNLKRLKQKNKKKNRNSQQLILIATVLSDLFYQANLTQKDINSLSEKELNEKLNQAANKLKKQTKITIQTCLDTSKATNTNKFTKAYKTARLSLAILLKFFPDPIYIGEEELKKIIEQKKLEGLNIGQFICISSFRSI